MSRETLAIFLVTVIVLNFVTYRLVHRSHHKLQFRLKVIPAFVINAISILGGAAGGFAAMTNTRTFKAGDISRQTMGRLAITHAFIVVTVIAEAIFFPDLRFDRL